MSLELRKRMIIQNYMNRVSINCKNIKFIILYQKIKETIRMAQR